MRTLVFPGLLAGMTGDDGTSELATRTLAPPSTLPRTFPPIRIGVSDSCCGIADNLLIIFGCLMTS